MARRANHKVTIPYALCIATQIPPVAVRLRRDWNGIRALIRTNAMMHQLNRETDDKGRIVATLDDYGAIRSLVADLVAEGIAFTVPPTVRETVETVAKLTTSEGVTVAAVAAELELERSAASRRLQGARARGYLVAALTSGPPGQLGGQPGRPARQGHGRLRRRVPAGPGEDSITMTHDHARPDTADMRAVLATTRAILSDGADHGTTHQAAESGSARPVSPWPGSLGITLASTMAGDTGFTSEPVRLAMLAAVDAAEAELGGASN